MDPIPVQDSELNIVELCKSNADGQEFSMNIICTYCKKNVINYQEQLGDDYNSTKNRYQYYPSRLSNCNIIFVEIIINRLEDFVVSV